MKRKLIISLAATALLGISGCSKQETGTTETSKAKESASSSTLEDSKSTTKTSSSKKEEKNKASKIDWDAAHELLKENMEAEKLTTIFENTEPIVNGNDQASFTINGYQYIKAENFSRDLRIPFGDQNKEGGILLVSATYKNTSDKSIFAGPGFTMNVVGYDAAVSRNKSLLEDDLVSELVEKKNEIKPNEELSGYVALAIKPAAMEKIAAAGTAEFELSGLYNQADSFSKDDAIVEPKKEIIALSGDGEVTKNESSKFYEDKATKDNMGTKTMLVEKELNQTEKFEDVNVTAEGYQISSFVPNEDQASRFSKFESGVVLMTVKVNVQNEGDESLNVDGTSATLTIGDSVKMMSENMLEVDADAGNVEKGSTATKYLVFVLDKDSYDKLYKDQDYLLDVSIYNSEFKRLTTIGDLSFEFSNQ
ncbi:MULTISPECIES: DUF4352 domain-containing protein [Enterococcus]|uniref:DUF4352 domain-containing protein n=1 Tax=Candidatus Enterococcus ferrettii TaxID=2815324 RepID=A0ABV0EU58_9ENTE|nr:DUF4352 domain-containing protein [Enterococcus sp. 665A]MBO1339857.1 DUF4352 domain-containing protein [Enterococcus sp. 665A]